MSKTETSPILLAVLKFDALSSSTRTLSATQAFDTSRSQIVLGSFKGRLIDKTINKDARVVTVGSTTTNHPSYVIPDKFQEVERQIATEDGLTAVALAVKNYKTPNIKLANELNIGVLKSRFIFDGVKMGSLNPGKNITIYDGVITLGLGEYKKWQDKYAVLKTNTVTEKAVLRIYEV